MATQIQLRRGTAAAWTAANPTLAEGELGLETDTGFFKFGDGLTAWSSLVYAAAPAGAKILTTAASTPLTAAVVIPGLAASADRILTPGGVNKHFDSATHGLTWLPDAPAIYDSDTTLPSHFYAKATDATSRVAYQAFAPSGDFKAWTQVGLAANYTDNNANVNLIIADGSYNMVHANLFLVPASHHFLVNAMYWNGATDTQQGGDWIIGGNRVYLKISRTGGVFSYWWSTTGRDTDWQLIATQTLSMTVAILGYQLTSGSAGSTEMASDFLRTDVTS